MTRVVVSPMQGAVASESPSAVIVFRGTGEFLVTGQESRQVYSFSEDQREQRVDARDVAELVQSGFFQVKS